jgi:sodium transport system permease protein
MRGVWIVFRKEMRETLRDTRTMLMMVVVPVLLYPVLLIAAEQLALFGMRRLEAEAARVALVGEEVWGLEDFLIQDEEIELVQVGDPEEAIRADSVQAVAVVGGGEGEDASQDVTILFDAANDRSQRGRQVLSAALRSWGDTLLERRIQARGLPSGFAHPLAVADSSIARPEELGGYALGRFLPMLLIMMTLLGAFYPAIDLAAGEKERGTLETLLTAPVPAGQIVAGKFVTVATVGVVAAGLNLISMLLTFQTGMFQITAALDVEFSLPWSSVAIIFATLIPLAVLFGALFLGIAVRSRSFKEAQNALTPVYMLVIVPALVPLFPGIDFSALLAVVPVAGVALFFRELMAGDAAWFGGVLALASTIVYAWIALAFAADAFGREDVLFGGESGEPKEKRNPLDRFLRPDGTTLSMPTPTQAFSLIGLVALLFFYLGVRFQIGMGERGLLVSEWLLLFLPVLLLIRAGGFDPVKTLSLRAPGPREVSAAILIIAGGTPIAWFIAWLQTFVFPIPWELLEQLEEMFTPTGAADFLWLLLLLAVTPAICEEVLFRGVLLSGTRRHLDPVRLILLNGAIFGAFHLSFETAFRFLPTAWLGVLLAWVVWRTGSIWTGSLMHFLNNGIVVLVAASPTVADFLARWEERPPLVMLPIAVACIGAGALLLRRSSHPEEVRAPEGG